jgi:hypothetical protein
MTIVRTWSSASARRTGSPRVVDRGSLLEWDSESRLARCAKALTPFILVKIIGRTLASRGGGHCRSGIDEPDDPDGSEDEEARDNAGRTLLAYIDAKIEPE